MYYMIYDDKNKQFYSMQHFETVAKCYDFLGDKDASEYTFMTFSSEPNEFIGEYKPNKVYSVQETIDGYFIAYDRNFKKLGTYTSRELAVKGGASNVIDIAN